MSASLDDMPAYEHFQDELDLELLRYAKMNNRIDVSIEHLFIQYICFQLFLSKPSEVTKEIVNHFLTENVDSEGFILDYIHFLNSDPNSFLKGNFNHLA
jgi:hypothetical protein